MSNETSTLTVALRFIFFFLLGYMGADLFFSCTAKGATLELNEERTVFLNGVVGPEFENLADKFMDLHLKDPDAPIDIVINSPGGSVYSGYRIIEMMNFLQERGATFRCVVPGLAASMAFQVLVHCNERYALPRSLLLWHPPAIFARGPINSYLFRYLAQQITIMAQQLTGELRERLSISDRDFWYHYRNETLWMAPDLVKASPGFLQIVTQVTGLEKIETLFSLRRTGLFGKKGEGTVRPRHEIIYIRGGAQ